MKGAISLFKLENEIDSEDTIIDFIRKIYMFMLVIYNIENWVLMVFMPINDPNIQYDETYQGEYRSYSDITLGDLRTLELSRSDMKIDEHTFNDEKNKEIFEFFEHYDNYDDISRYYIHLTPKDQFELINVQGVLLVNPPNLVGNDPSYNHSNEMNANDPEENNNESEIHYANNNEELSDFHNNNNNNQINNSNHTKSINPKRRNSDSVGKRKRKRTKKNNTRRNRKRTKHKSKYNRAFELLLLKQRGGKKKIKRKTKKLKRKK